MLNAHNTWSDWPFWPVWPVRLYGPFGLFGLFGLRYRLVLREIESFTSVLRVVNMTKRGCRDCSVPDCGAKYLVRLANHLANVHMLDIDQRRKYLQEAKRHPTRLCRIQGETTRSKTCTGVVMAAYSNSKPK